MTPRAVLALDELLDLARSQGDPWVGFVAFADAWYARTPRARRTEQGTRRAIFRLAAQLRLQHRVALAIRGQRPEAIRIGAPDLEAVVAPLVPAARRAALAREGEEEDETDEEGYYPPERLEQLYRGDARDASSNYACPRPLGLRDLASLSGLPRLRVRRIVELGGTRIRREGGSVPRAPTRHALREALRVYDERQEIRGLRGVHAVAVLLGVSYERARQILREHTTLRAPGRPTMQIASEHHDDQPAVDPSPPDVLCRGCGAIHVGLVALGWGMASDGRVMCATCLVRS